MCDMICYACSNDLKPSNERKYDKMHCTDREFTKKGKKR